MKKNIILDVDTGIDDAMAIALGAFSNKLNVKLITTIAGNLSVNAVTKNTLNLLQALEKRNIPVAVGANAPLEREKDNSIQAHGKRGLGKFKFPPLELKPTKLDAVEKMHEVISKSKEPIIIIALGPLTNVASLLLKYPEDMDNIEYIVISGGLLNDSKRHPYLSFNIMQDPEAARYVMKSGEKIVICPSNHGHTAYFNLDDIEDIRTTNKTGEMFEFMFRSYKDRHVKVGAATHDPCAVAFASNPEIFKSEMMYVHIRFLKEEQTGVIDFDPTKAPNCKVLTEINPKKFKKIFMSALKKMP
ncbi:MAG: ribonucleoside hydrolase RihC [Clostridiales bacterium]|nr:ribonucleoside hydrolase RihC [Clostridiales bacterium]